MPDYLVRLYDLPPLEPALQKAGAMGGVVRRVLAPERSILRDWVLRHFSRNWADECDVAFSNRPASCFIASRTGGPDKQPEILGFACYNSIFKGFFGPTGTSEQVRNHGVGRALLLTTLHAMWSEGYAYAIIGSGGGAEGFYERVVKATKITGSDPGAYKDLLFPLEPDQPADGANL